MRKVLYGGAIGLDGFIAGPNGEYDWIVMDPDIDFAEMMGQFDTFLIGRKTFEAMRRMGSDVAAMPGTQNIVCSRTLRPGEYRMSPSAPTRSALSPICERSRARTSPSLGAASCSEVCWPRDWSMGSPSR